MPATQNRIAVAGALVLTAAIATLLLVACSSGGGKTLTLGNIKVSDHGTKDASGAQNLEVEADDYYFDPTFVRGTPGETLTLEVKNDANRTHNISVNGQNVSMDIPAKGNVEVQVKFPQSGVLQFFCKYHTGQGMNGELLVGNATPQAPSGAAPGGDSTGGSGY